MDRRQAGNDQRQQGNDRNQEDAAMIL